MYETANIPSLFRPVMIAGERDPRAEARKLAAEGVEPGTLVWNPRPDRFRCSVVLAPNRPLEDCLPAIYIAAVALGDALGKLVPAGVDLTFEWPNLIEINGGRCAELALDLPADVAAGAVPDWLVLSCDVAISGDENSDFDADDLSHTTLHEESCFDINPANLVEYFARYLLSWINRWEDDGFDPVRKSWTNRTPDHGQEVGLDTAGEWIVGKLVGLRDNGDLEIEVDGETQVYPLADAI